MLRARHHYGIETEDMILWMTEPGCTENWVQQIASAYQVPYATAREMVEAPGGWGIAILRRSKVEKASAGETAEGRAAREALVRFLAEHEQRFLAELGTRPCPTYLLVLKWEASGDLRVWVHDMEGALRRPTEVSISMSPRGRM
jgi:hypothetical protein